METSKRLFIILSLILVSANIDAQKKSTDWINGTWRGTGFQLDNSTSWSIQFLANNKVKTFQIDYGTLNCSGIWEVLKIDDNQAKFTERITKGKDKCLDGSIIIITRVSENYVSYSCFSSNGKKLDACSTLEKVN